MNGPLVTGIMPTRGREALAHQALDCFLSQTYEHKNLVILDDREKPSFPKWNHVAGVEYVLDEPLNIPKKRNLCCERATGEIIMHFDSDDWSAAERMGDQVARLLESGKPFTGYNSMLFYAEGKGAYRYTGRTNYAIGTSFAFTKKFWAAHPFPENRALSSDNILAYAALYAGDAVTAPAGRLMVARIHRHNSNPKHLTAFKKVPDSELPDGFQVECFA